MKHDKEVQKTIDAKFGKMARMLPDERKSKGPYEATLRTGPSGDVEESPLANPDILSDENVLLPESQEARDRQQLIHDRKVYAINNCKLTPKQRKVIELLEKGYIQEEIAQELGIVRPAVTELLNRARKKIQDFYKKYHDISENE